MLKYLPVLVVVSTFSLSAWAGTGLVGNEKCDLLSVKGRKNEAALCYKKEAKENLEIIEELREAYDPSGGVVLSGYTPQEVKELRFKLESGMAAIRKACRHDECVAGETRQLIHYFSQVSLARNASR
jgi:hypothetical protein